MPPRSGLKRSILVVLVLIVVVIGSVSYLGWRQSVPGVASSTAAPRFVGHQSPLNVVVEARRGNVASLEVRLVQGDTTAVVHKQEGGLGRRAEVPITLTPAKHGLREGAATLEIWARDDFWRPLQLDPGRVASQAVTIDLTPPKLEILAATRYLAQGGSGLVAFRATGASEAVVGAGPLAFPSFPVGPSDQGARVALLALPYDFAAGTPLQITARDEAGNTVTRGIPAEVRPKRFPRDTIDLKEPFLQAKVPELLPQRPPDQPLLEGFLVINRDQRRQAEEQKRRVGATSADKPLWDGAFVQPRNTKVFANFAETRTYFYGGREVDTQVHYGYDLASTRQAPVPAANAGTVVFAEPLTIYGNTVILDHGWGLQTLYSHLSRIDVKVGDQLAKGQELGRSGTTGLAIGDHIHYEVLVHGISVSPLEWWDARWIRDHIGQPLQAAGLAAVAGAR